MWGRVRQRRGGVAARKGAKLPGRGLHAGCQVSECQKQMARGARLGQALWQAGEALRR